MANQKNKTLVLAFDIESAGANHDVIGLGICVLDDQLTVHDKRLWPAYFPGVTQFEPRCKQEFWNDHTDVLERLVYQGTGSPEHCRAKMITEFWETRQHWETYATEQGYCFQLACDSSVFDAAELNKLAERHLPNTKPMPYNTFDKYCNLYETFNMQRGFLMAVDPTFTEEYDLNTRIKELFNLPHPAVQANHCPENDAYVIAYDLHMLNGIREGRYQPVNNK